MHLSRRHFLHRAAAYSAGFAGLHRFMGCATARPIGAAGIEPYGPLLPDPEGVLDLPAGFRYSIISRAGEEMADGLLVSGKPDGMAAFPGPDGLTLVVRNHEMERVYRPSPFGKDLQRLSRVAKEMLYDTGADGTPSFGGTSTLVYDTRPGEPEGELVRQFASLLGTERNCAGGPTPRGTWISCEESVASRGGRFAKHHGYCFEVPATAEPALAEPRPIRGMGRFYHEACATDPATGIIYMTEDRHEGLIYRFIPGDPNDLHAGGRLQALVVAGEPHTDTRNWQRAAIAPGRRLPVEWLDMDDVEPEDDSLRHRGFAQGAARFARGEGMWMGRRDVFWACTNGGRAKCGQLFRLTPSRDAERPDTLELFVESPGPGVIQHADNICVAPWGDLIVCEDSGRETFLLGVTPGGEVYRLGRNALSNSELAGATFSPDATTLFLNIQHDGLTLAIRGPWKRAK